VTGEIMIADWFMIICYAIIVIGIIENIILILLNNSKDPKKKMTVAYVEQWAHVFVWLVCPCFFLFLFIPWWAAFICLIVPATIAWVIKYVNHIYLINSIN
jgi:hypothetical protein